MLVANDWRVTFLLRDGDVPCSKVNARFSSSSEIDGQNFFQRDQCSTRSGTETLLRSVIAACPTSVTSSRSITPESGKARRHGTRLLACATAGTQSSALYVGNASRSVWYTERRLQQARRVMQGSTLVRGPFQEKVRQSSHLSAPWALRDIDGAV